jgi:hypothetical protein
MSIAAGDLRFYPRDLDERCVSAKERAAFVCRLEHLILADFPNRRMAARAIEFYDWVTNLYPGRNGFLQVVGGSGERRHRDLFLDR